MKKLNLALGTFWLAAHGLGGCSGDTDATTVVEANQPAGSAVDPAGSGGTGSAEAPGETDAPSPSVAEGPAYVINTMIADGDGTLSYVNVLQSLEPQVIDQSRGREFSGTADVWVHDGFVYVTSDESFTITKFSVEGDTLVEQGVVSFAAYGLSSFGFWLNTFVAPDKAYFLNDTLEYIVWDPQRMEITGNIPLPEPEPREVHRLYTAYSDRSAVVRGGLLYQPFYWVDESFFQFAQDTRIIVTDVATNSVVDVLDAPCPGLDYATVDANQNIYFSAWVYAPGGAAVLAQPSTCVFELPAVGEPRVAFDLPSVTEGRQGGVLRIVGDSAVISVLHDERFAASETPDAAALTFADNWRFWSYDLATGSASPIEAIDWNAGAQYSFDIDATTYTLVADADYAATTIYDIGSVQSAVSVFETRGWATRLFKVR